MPWIVKPPLNTGRWSLAGVTADAPSPGSGYRIYALGGNAGSGPVNTVELYDTAAPGWVAGTGMLTAREGLGAVTASTGIYAVGGDNGSAALATTEIYDPAADAWTAGPSLGTARSELGVAIDHSGVIYAIGGFDGSTQLTVVEVLDPSASASWAPGVSLPVGLAQFAAVTGPDGKIYAIGGNTPSGPSTAVYVYDPSLGSWSTGDALPAGVGWAISATVGPDGLIYAIGGFAPDGGPQQGVYTYNPAAPGPWTSIAPIPASDAPSLLAAVTGPDGLIYAIGGQLTSLASNTVEAFESPTALSAPDPYIGDGTYQSPDIILLDSTGNPVPVGGKPGGAWDTLLVPLSNYGIQAVVYNDSPVASTATTVEFWHFPGGVGTAGVLLDSQVTSVPANNSVVVTSSQPFTSGAPGAHECVAVSIYDPESAYFSVEPTSGPDVIDPTVGHPPGSKRFGSAWRNTNSLTMGGGMQWRFGFGPIRFAEPAGIELGVTTTRVPAGFEILDDIAQVIERLEYRDTRAALPLFLIPEVRALLPPVDLGVTVEGTGVTNRESRAVGQLSHHLTVSPSEPKTFAVAGRIPVDAKDGEVFLIDVSATYPAHAGLSARTVSYLEVVYVTS